MKRVLVVVLLLSATEALAVNYCGRTNHINTCGRPSNIYPCCPNGSNCTWWAWEMACRNWGIGFNNWGNANTWAYHARLDPRVVVGAPRPGTIATSTLGNYGHVAWTIGYDGPGVTVTEQNCCSGCSANTRTIRHPTGKFNSGYVAKRGSECSCSGGTQTEACGNCGTRSRGCDGCNWGGWSSCQGADPGGGTVVCDVGRQGVCEDARQRCIGGNLACKSLVEASDETCDGLDNDCDGETDEGNPPIGAKRPDFAATLLDSSYPRTLTRGERATIWAEFKNEGTQAWTTENMWLATKADTKLKADSWPAFNVAATLQTPVQPGETGRFSFEIVAPSDMTGEVAETFTLQVAGGRPIACPSGEIVTEIRILRDPTAENPISQPGDAGEQMVMHQVATNGGCSAAPGLSMLGTLAARWLSRRRRSV